MDEFVQYNAGLESRIKYRFHFDDYTVDELVVIVNLKMKAMGYQMTADAASSLGAIIDKGTTAELRSKYNGRLTDNLLQWASNEMNERLPLDATGDQLITLSKSDLATAIGRFATARPPVKKDPALLGGEQVEPRSSHSCRTIPTHDSDSPSYPHSYRRSSTSSRSGTHRVLAVLHQGGVPQPDRPRPHGGEGHPRARAHEGCRRPPRDVARDAAQAGAPPDELEMDALYIDPDTQDMRTWLDKRGLGEYAKVFDRHRIDWGARRPHVRRRARDRDLGGGPRRKVYRAIAQWRDERDAKKAEARAHAAGGTAREPRLARRRRPAARW